MALYDFGRTEDGRIYYAREYLEGLPLDALLKTYGPLPAGRVVYLLAQACGALAEAHGQWRRVDARPLGKDSLEVYERA